MCVCVGVEELKGIKVSREYLNFEAREKSSVQRYKSFLQSQYNQSEVVRDDKLFISPSNKFIDMVFLKHGQDFSESKNRTKNSSSKIVSLENIIELMDKFVFLIGESGMGKSTAAFELCRHWDDWKKLEKFEIVLLLKLRESRIQLMAEVSDLFYHQDKELSKAIANGALKNDGEGILLIFDGLDELPDSVVEDQGSLLMELIVGKCLPKSVKFITSRPKALYLKPKLFPKEVQVVELQGFTEENGSKYFEVAFQSKPTLLKHIINHVLANPIFNLILTVPVNCAILAAIYEDMYKSVLLPKTMTELYYKLVLVYIRRFMIGQGDWKPETKLVQSILELPEPILSHFNSVSKVAYNGYMNAKSIQSLFTDSDIEEGFCHLGLMNEDSELYVSRGLKKRYSFFHLSLQEFLAAWHALSCPSLDLQYFKHMLLWGQRDKSESSKAPFIDCDGFRLGTLNITYDPFIPFLFGHSRVVHNDEIMKFLHVTTLHVGGMKRIALGSIFECQQPELWDKSVCEYQDITLGSRLDMYLFAYVLQHSSCNWFVRAYCCFGAIENILKCSDHILGSVQELDLRCRKSLEYSGLQYLPLHKLQEFKFTVTSSTQCHNVLALFDKLSNLYGISVTMKLSQRFCTSTNDTFFRCVKNDHSLFKSCQSLASLGRLVLTFYDLTKEGLFCLCQVISCKKLQNVKLIMLNQDLVHFGVTAQHFNPLLKSLCSSTSLTSLKINFGHDVLSYSLCTSYLKQVCMYLEDIDVLYELVSVLNSHLHQHSSNIDLEIYTHCKTKLDLPKLSKALRQHYHDTGRHTRSKSLSRLDGFYEEECYSESEDSDDNDADSDDIDDGSCESVNESSQYYTSADSYFLQNWDSYSLDATLVNERSWKRSCPDLVYIQEMNTLHPVLCKALKTSNLYYRKTFHTPGFMSFKW